MRASIAPSADLPHRDVLRPLHVVSTHTPRRSPLKICFITETFHAGVGRHVVDSVLELSRRAHDVHLIYSPIRSQPEFLAALEGQPNVHCKAVSMPRGIGSGDISAFRAIKNYVRAQGPFDIVHGHSSKGGGYARLLKVFGVRTVFYSPHALVTLSPVPGLAKRLFYRGLERTLAMLTNRIVCASRGEFDHAAGLHIAAHRLALIPYGSTAIVAPERAALRAELGLAPDRIVVGFAGRMEDQKAPQRLIAAALQVLPDFPDVTLLMVGDGPKRAALEAQLDRAGLGGRAIWLGAVNARVYMPAMDIFVVPSLYEGFAYVLIEALYAGLPIVTTPVGGSHESVTPGVNGFIVPHESPTQMSGTIRTMVADGALRVRMSASSRVRADYFSIPRMVDSLEDDYFSAIASQPAPLETPVVLSPANLT